MDYYSHRFNASGQKKSTQLLPGAGPTHAPAVNGQSSLCQKHLGKRVESLNDRKESTRE